jgi:hypothetical protein
MVAELITLHHPTQLEINSDPDAVIIGNLYRRGCTAMADGMRYFLDAGRRLIAKRAELKAARRNWLPWLEANEGALGFKRRAAQLLMKAAHNYASSNTQSTAYLDINDPHWLLKFNRQMWGNSAVRGTLGTGDNEWFTPPQYIAAAKEVMGGIDIDPASHPKAQQTVAAKDYCTRAGGDGALHNGLEWPWRGRVWLNPPYGRDDIGPFVDKLLAEIRRGNTTAAIMLTHNYTDTDWFQAAVSMVDVLCFTKGRIKFYDERDEVCNPTQGQVFFYYGRDIEGFHQLFQDFGFVTVPWRFIA